MNEEQLRAEISAANPAVRVVWIGHVPCSDKLSAVVEDRWGQYLWPHAPRQDHSPAASPERPMMAIQAASSSCRSSSCLSLPGQLFLFGDPA
jgi:hypothetical protein